ncbi:hypothetical protein YC2023_025367 [Brassica napus]
MRKNFIVARASPYDTVVDSDHHTHHDILSQCEAMSCGARCGRGSLVMLIHGERKDEPQSNWVEVYRSYGRGSGSTKNKTVLNQEPSANHNPNTNEKRYKKKDAAMAEESRGML